MNYLETLNFWSKQGNSPDSWDYEAIEKRMTNKLVALTTYYKDSRDKALKSILTSTLQLDDLHTKFNQKDYAQSEKIIIHSPKHAVFYVGDIHSDAAGLDDIIRQTDPYNTMAELIFLGDYVDRGKKHLETLDKLWALKLDLPEQVTLLRGNHDGGYYEKDQVILPYRLDSTGSETDYFPLYLDILQKKNLITKEFNQLYFDFCDLLPQVIFSLQNKQWYMGVHGGLPRPSAEPPYYDSIESIGSLEDMNTLDHFKQPLLDNLFWSDPREGSLGEINHKRRFQTYEEHFNSFSNRFGVAEVIRGHETVKTGHLSIYNGRMHTIFSSGSGSPDTAYTKVITPKILKLIKGYALIEVDIIRKQ